MRSFRNTGDVANQVGGDQIFNGPVYYQPQDACNHQHGTPGQRQLVKQDEPMNEVFASLAFPQMFNRRSGIDAPHEHTCQWILTADEYLQWRSHPSGLLWIKGKPGAGKSTLMSFLYDHIRHDRSKDTIYLDFFFSARGSELQRTPLGMLRSLLNQLFRQDTSSYHLIRDMYNEKCAAFGHRRHAWEWQQRELQTLFKNAIIASAKTRPIEIFIDALDEAGAQSAREIARYLHMINDRAFETSLSCKFCISCRHYPVVSQILGIEVCVEDHNADDISLFVRDRMRMYKQCVDDPVAYDSLVETLTAKTRGVFQWISLVVLMVEKSIDDGESLETVQRDLDQVPGELSEVYHHIILHIIDERYRIISLHLFQWVCLALRPLSPTEMEFALTAQDRVASTSLTVRDSAYGTGTLIHVTEKSIRAWSGGLLEISPYIFTDENPVNRYAATAVQVVHQSVNDFLLLQGLLLLSTLFKISPARATQPTPDYDLMTSEAAICHCHGLIYRACLSYIMVEADDDAISSQLMYDRTKTSVAPRPDISFTYPLLRYTVQNVFVHATRAHEYRGMVVQDETGVLNDVLPRWSHADCVFEHILWPVPMKTRTALHVAADINSPDMIGHLIERGMDINAIDHHGYAAIHLAAASGHLDCMKLLFMAGVDINTVTLHQQSTPLILAASGAHIDAVRWLLGKSARLNEPDNDRVGRGIFWPDKPRSALCAAVSSGSLLLVQILIDAGADTNSGGSSNGNALIEASKIGSYLMVQLLLKHGADSNVENGVQSALSCASEHGHESIVRLLLESGAKVNGPGNALALASGGGHESIVRLLVRCGAHINDQTDGETAICCASASGHASIVQFLIESGAEIDSPSGYESAISLAAVAGHETVVQQLIQAGAQLNDIFDGRQSSALELASRNRDGSMMSLLKNAGAKALYD